MQLFQRQTIHKRFFLLNMLVVVPVVLLVAIIGNIVFRTALTTKARDAQIREVSLISNSLDVVVENINDYLLTLSVDNVFQDILRNNPSVPQDQHEIYDLQRALPPIVFNKTGLNSYIDSVGLMSRSGEFFRFGEYDLSELEKLVESGQVPLSPEHNRPEWNGPFRLNHRVQGLRTVFLVAKPVMDLYAPNYIGAVLLAVKEEDLSNFYKNSFGESSTFLVVNEAGTIVSAQDTNLVLTQASALENLPFSLSETAQEGNTVQSAKGEDFLVTTCLLNRGKWMGTSAIRMAALTQDLWVVNAAMLGLGLVSILLAILLGATLARSVSRPIVQLAEVMKNIDNATLDTRIQVADSPVELRQLGLGFNSLMDRINTLMAQVRQQQQQKRKDEFRLLQSQIQPHFLYNTLETIQSLVGLGMNQQADTYIKNLAEFYRISLSSGRDIIPLHKEIEVTRHYLSLQHIRYIDSFDFSIEEDHNLNEHHIPKLTLQPIVENAIYHGVKPLKNKSHITVQTRQEGNVLVVSVRDNGTGMPQHQVNTLLKGKEKSAGFGLRSVHNRLQIMYGAEWGLSIQSKEGSYTCVEVRLPLNGEEMADATNSDC